MEFDLTGNYPLILNGEEAGTLTVSRDGLYWVFDARAAQRTALVRLSVYGEDGEGYLGVMEPCGENLVLTRRLSRSALAGFPSTITHAGNQADQPLEAEVESPLDVDTSRDKGDEIPTDEAKPPSRGIILPPDANWRPCPCPCALLSSPFEKSAFGAARAAFFAEDRERTFLAVPRDAAAVIAGGQAVFLFQKFFGITPYSICIIKNGRIVQSPV